MPELAKTIRQWFGAPNPHLDASPEAAAARAQLQGHINAELLQSFLQRAVDPQQHQTVVTHLNECDPCRGAIAIALLAVDDPQAAAELRLEQKRLIDEEPEPWWRQGLRWSALVILALLIVITAVLIPKSKDPNSPVGKWFDQADSSVGQLFGKDDESTSTSTSFGQIVSSTYESAKPEKPRRAQRGVERQPGWDTGPAPYVGRVEASAPFKEVDISGDEREESEKPAASTAPTAASSDSASRKPAHSARRRLVVGPGGQLKRTLDGGDTWQLITVAPNLVFRSLALSGRTVWAAGSGGALYRSSDAAEHWQEVQIHYRGEPIKDDFVDIEFSDPQHGFLRSATGREWISVDGGTKWVLNPTTANAK